MPQSPEIQRAIRNLDKQTLLRLRVNGVDLTDGGNVFVKLLRDRNVEALKFFCEVLEYKIDLSQKPYQAEKVGAALRSRPSSKKLLRTIEILMTYGEDSAKEALSYFVTNRSLETLNQSSKGEFLEVVLYFLPDIEFSDQVPYYLKTLGRDTAPLQLACDFLKSANILSLDTSQNVNDMVTCLRYATYRFSFNQENFINCLSSIDSIFNYFEDHVHQCYSDRLRGFIREWNEDEKFKASEEKDRLFHLATDKFFSSFFELSTEKRSCLLSQSKASTDFFWLMMHQSPELEELANVISSAPRKQRLYRI